MDKELTLSRLVTMEECPWLGRDYECGETVYRYTGPTYGCVAPDGVACTSAPDETPFFELPAAALAKARAGKGGV